MSMRIIIPTRGRITEQLTMKYISKKLYPETTVVCPEKEVRYHAFHHKDVEVVGQPDPDWTIAQKRVWIMQEWNRRGYDKIIMLDDDIRFATRISETDWHLRECNKEELIGEFKRIEDKLGEECPHVGFGQRQGNNYLKEVGWASPGKMCYSLGYYLPVVLKECELGRIGIREDMELSLQLLLKGYPNAIWTRTVTDQREYGRTGGASTERTMEISNADAEKLAQLFPGYVSVVRKEYLASIPRLEVMVQWSKAYQDGQRRKNAAQRTPS